MTNYTINSSRLWQRLNDMAEIGATSLGGCNRQALTELDKKGRDLLVSWCKNAGCFVEIDKMGNIFATRAGSSPMLAPVATGSHLDTQPAGGKYDGVFGVLAGLEVLDTLNDLNITTKHSLQLVVWTNEEGARYAPAMMGSGVFAGVIDLEQTYLVTDKEGNTVKDDLLRIGYLGDKMCNSAANPFHAFLETHIEQGPILENANKQIGIVTGAQGISWYDIVITGKASHAGTTPMSLRKDAVLAMTKILSALYQQIAEQDEDVRLTFGDIYTEPKSRNTIPSQVVLKVDLRHPDQEKLVNYGQILRQLVKKYCDSLNLDFRVDDVCQAPAMKFDNNCIATVSASADELGYSSQQITSGAGHDSVYVARVAPTAMIFIPCKDGISHNEIESITIEQAECGANVLLNSLIKLSN